MAKISITKGQLYNCYGEIMNMRRSGSIMAYFMGSKIRQWENDNMVRVNSLLEELKKIETDHYKHEVVSGQVEYAKDENNEPMFNDGMDKESLESSYAQLMSQETSMEI